jgi:hypothetical protein
MTAMVRALVEGLRELLWNAGWPVSRGDVVRWALSLLRDHVDRDLPGLLREAEANAHGAIAPCLGSAQSAD